MTRRLWLAFAVTLVATACEAGPSAFDRSRDIGPVKDTADASTLPDVPLSAQPVDTPGVEDDPASAPSSTAAAPEPPMQAFVGAVGDSAGAAGPSAATLGSTRSEPVRGIYLNAWASGSSRRTAALLDLAERTEINAFVIDVKDATGYVSHDTSVPLAREIGATGEIRIADLPGLVARLKAAGVYPIARIVIVKDPLLAAARPEWAVQDSAGGVWVSKDLTWLNPYDERVWAYHVELAREVAAMGFEEIQWDYVRFPDSPLSDRARAVYPGSEGRLPAEAIRDFLAYSRRELAPLGVAVTADVFGVTTSVRRDVGVGQVWESFIDQVDVALPMIYPSHYWEGSFGFEKPNAHPYEVVHAALTDALRRSAAVEGAGATRPWLQDFTLGEPRYGAPEVRAQIQATYDAGIQEWILWNPSSRYTEEALEPVGGWATPPLVRVGGRVVQVSRRQEVLDSVARARAAPEEAEGDAPEAGATEADAVEPDTVPAPRPPARR